VTRLRAQGHSVLIVSTTAESAPVLAAIEAGAAGYISKDHNLAALADAVRRVARAASAIPPDLAFMLSGVSAKFR